MFDTKFIPSLNNADTRLKEHCYEALNRKYSGIEIPKAVVNRAASAEYAQIILKLLFYLENYKDLFDNLYREILCINKI